MLTRAFNEIKGCFQEAFCPAQGDVCETADDLPKTKQVEVCVEIKILRRVRAESSRRPSRHRRDACSMAWRCRFPTARRSQRGRVVAEKWLSEELSGAPDTLVDFHTDLNFPRSVDHLILTVHEF